MNVLGGGFQHERGEGSAERGHNKVMQRNNR